MIRTIQIIVENNIDFTRNVDVLYSNRATNGRYMDMNRQTVETNGEMALYFIITDPNLLPNRKALEFHKTACLIWRMVGGAESFDEYCSDDDEADFRKVDTAALKRRFNLQDSADTLNVINI